MRVEQAVLRLCVALCIRAIPTTAGAAAAATIAAAAALAHSPAAVPICRPPQPVKSFKLRGAYNKMAQLTPEQVRLCVQLCRAVLGPCGVAAQRILGPVAGVGTAGSSRVAHLR